MGEAILRKIQSGGIIRGNHAVVAQCGFVAMMSSRC